MDKRVKGLIRSIMPRTIRPRRIVGGPLRGAWLVTSWHDYPAGLSGRTERALLDWFSAHVRSGDTWVDVGAHYGYTTLALARLVGPSGRVFAFEPIVATAGCLDQARTLNRFEQVSVLPFGLGSTDTLEVLRLPVTRGMADSTMSQGRDAAVASVPMARFDWIWSLVNGGDGAIHGVKIDVQGMELEALNSMREALARWHPHVVVEFHAGVSREQVLALLGSLGYASNAEPIEPVRGEHTPRYLDNRSYAFRQASTHRG